MIQITWSYSGNPADSELDSVRFLVGDTDEKDQLINDEEIEFLLSLETNLYKASAKVAESIAGKFSRFADQSIGDYSISYSDLSDKYFALAESLRSTAKRDIAIKSALAYAGGISKADKLNQKLDSDRVRPAFARNLMDIRKFRIRRKK